MLTQCPNCYAVYSLSAINVHQADGWVRCGECDAPFDAISQIVEEDEEYLPENYQLPPTPLNSGNNAPLLAATTEKVSKLPSILMISFLFVILAGQYIWFRGNKIIVRYPAMEAVVGVFCKNTGCPHIKEEDNSSEEFILLSSSIRKHKNFDGLVVVSALFMHQSPDPVPYPSILLTMTNIRGDQIGQRVLSPAAYSNARLAAGALINPSQIAEVLIEVVAPDTRGLSFELNFI